MRPTIGSTTRLRLRRLLKSIRPKVQSIYSYCFRPWGVYKDFYTENIRLHPEYFQAKKLQEDVREVFYTENIKLHSGYFRAKKLQKNVREVFYTVNSVFVDVNRKANC